MKKFALAAVAAVIATVSLSSVAEARRRHFDDVDVVIIKNQRPHCKTMKIVEIGRHDHKKATIAKKCR